MKKIYDVLSPRKTKTIRILGLFVLFFSTILITVNMLYTNMTGIVEHPKYWEFKTVFGPFYHLLYFTNISNVFLGIMIVVLVLKPSCKLRQNLFFVSVILISITFVVYWLLISWGQPWIDPIIITTSITTHGIHPLIGFVVLYLMRKEIKLTRQVIFISSAIVLTYFFFALVLYLVTGAPHKFKDGAIIYSFMHFRRPFFTTTSNLGLIIALDLLIFVIGAFIPVIFAFLWKLLFNLKVTLKRQMKH